MNRAMAEEGGAFAVRVIEASGVTGKPMDQIEIEASRRALATIKNRLGSARLMELLRSEIEETDRLWEEWARQSDGEWSRSTVVMEVTGITSQRWIDWIKSNLSDEAMHFSVHPEHYVWKKAADIDSGFSRGDYIICELVGRFIFRIYIEIAEWQGWEKYADPEFPTRMMVSGYTRNGVEVLRSIAQYRPIPGGFIFKYDGFHPAAIPAPASSTAEQVVLEYSNYMRTAYERHFL